MTKVTLLDALTGAAGATTDLVNVVDVSDTTMAATGTNKKMTLAELVTFLGANGIAIHGIPAGGSTLEVLTKTSGTDYAADWEPAVGMGGGGNADAYTLLGNDQASPTPRADLGMELVRPMLGLIVGVPDFDWPPASPEDDVLYLHLAP